MEDELKKNKVVKGVKHTYLIKSMLGKGGFGITYLAMVREGGKVYLYALKEFFLKAVCSREQDGRVTCSQGAMEIYEDSRKDFMQEARRLEQLKVKNENIVRVEEAFESNNTAYFAMEYLDGDDLMKKVLHEGVMDEREMAGVMEPIIRAVGFLHENRMLHLDLKPANVVMRTGDEGEETPVLIDFGVSMHFDTKGKPTTSSRFVGGTRGYAPLEQAQGIDTFSPWVDVYALGATMYFLLTGEAPEKASYDTYVRVGEKLRETGVSERVQKAIVHAMQPNPMDRTGSAAQLLKELKEGPAENEEKENADGKKDERTVGSNTVSIKDKTIKKEKTKKDQRREEKDDDKPTPRDWKKMLWVLAGVAVVAGIIALWPKGEAGMTEEESVDTVEAIKDYETISVNGVEFGMVRVEGGTFTMGCTSEQGEDCYDNEKPAHSVTVSSYYIGETEVTQALWKAVVGNSPSYFKGDNLPVEQVSWDDAQEFIVNLNRLTGRTFRLPTEAEWEYAARGGSKSRGYKYSGSNSIDAVGWYWYNSEEKSHVVKGKQANELGLYDMNGNVWELCSDRYVEYSTESQRDLGGLSIGSDYVQRGGGWGNFEEHCRVSNRGITSPDDRNYDLGFRLVMCP